MKVEIYEEQICPSSADFNLGTCLCNSHPPRSTRPVRRFEEIVRVLEEYFEFQRHQYIRIIINQEDRELVLVLHSQDTQDGEEVITHAIHIVFK